MLSFLKKSLSSTSDSFDGSKSKEAAVEDKAVESALEAIHEQELTRWKETVYDIIRVSEPSLRIWVVSRYDLETALQNVYLLISSFILHYQSGNTRPREAREPRGAVGGARRTRLGALPQPQPPGHFVFSGARRDSAHHPPLLPGYPHRALSQVGNTSHLGCYVLNKLRNQVKSSI